MERLLGRDLGWVAICIAMWVAFGACIGGDDDNPWPQFEPSGMVDDPTGEADYLIDFEVVPLHERKVMRTSVANTGDGEMVITSPRPGPPFSHDIPSSGLTIRPGGTAQIAFGFEPVEESEAPVQLVVPLNIGNRASARTVRLVGHGKQTYLDCDPASLDFGSVRLASEKTLSASCTNPLEIGLEVLVGAIRGEHARSFSARIPDETDGRMMLEPGGTLRLEVRFASEFLGLNDATVELRGAFDQLLAAIPVRANASNTAVVMEPEGCLDFAHVDVGESEVRSLLLRTIGDERVQIDQLKVAGESRDHFSLLTSAPLTLTPGEDPLEILLEFHPTSSGSHHALIEVYTDDPRPDAGPIRACATGRGRHAISCHPEALDFGMVAVGVPGRQLLECIDSSLPGPGAENDPLVLRALRSTDPAFSAKVLDLDTQAEGPRPGGYQPGEGFVVEVVYAPVEEGPDGAIIELEFESSPVGVIEIPVSGRGRHLPPCEFSLLSPAVHFGFEVPR